MSCDDWNKKPSISQASSWIKPSQCRCGVHSVSGLEACVRESYKISDLLEDGMMCGRLNMLFKHFFSTFCVPYVSLPLSLSHLRPVFPFTSSVGVTKWRTAYQGSSPVGLPEDFSWLPEIAWRLCLTFSWLHAYWYTRRLDDNLTAPLLPCFCSLVRWWKDMKWMPWKLALIYAVSV